MCENSQEILTVKEVQDILHISVNSAYALIHSGSFPVKRIGNTYRIPRNAFYTWLNQSAPAATPNL